MKNSKVNTNITIIVLIVMKIIKIKIKRALIMMINCKNMETSVVTINSFKHFQIAK